MLLALTQTLMQPTVADAEPAWSISDLPGLELWTDGTDATTMFDAVSGGSQVAPDGAVARWEDKSPNDNHATQSVSNNRPLYKSGDDGLEYDGTNDGLELTTPIELGAQFSAFFVLRDDGAAATGFMAAGGGSAGSGSTYQGYFWISRVPTEIWLRLDGEITGGTITHDVPDAQFALLEFHRDGASIAVYCNGALIATMSGGSATEILTVRTLGWSYSSAYTLEGILSQVVLCNGLLSTEDKDLARQYLADLYGITLP